MSVRPPCSLPVAATAASALLMGTAAWADIIHVPGDFPTIQAAIEAADGGDEIVVAPGTYFEMIDLLGKPITLRSSRGAEVTSIDGQELGRVVTCIGGEGTETVLDGFTISGGQAENGGGMFCNGASPTVLNCTFRGNAATLGGGMYNRHNAPVIANCVFVENTAVDGGGVFNWGANPRMSGCVFHLNTALDGEGGVVASVERSSPTFVDCEFAENSARWGGAISDDDSSTTLRNCVFANNTAEWGGALRGNTTVGHQETDLMMTMSRCVFVENVANSSGGALNFDNGIVRIHGCFFVENSAVNRGGAVMLDDVSELDTSIVTNCVFYANTADSGGAVYIQDGRPVYANCTITLNQAQEGGGVVVARASEVTFASIYNCILWGNATDQIVLVNGAHAELNYCDIQGGWRGKGVGNVDADPTFVDPRNGDLWLAAGSPCIDAGDNTSIDDCLLDADGNERFIDDRFTDDTGLGKPPIVDIGAFEFGAAPVADCNLSGFRDDCELGLDGDCNGNGIPDDCDILDGISNDCNVNWMPDECEDDCNGNGVPDDCDIADGTSADCNSNGRPDSCDIADGLDQDCNQNGVPDQCDLDSGESEDCNQNGVLDECDIETGVSEDRDGNGIPDECDADCNANGVPDFLDILFGDSADCNANRIPDECDIDDGTSVDDDGNGIPDECELDCNGNGVPDIEDILDGTSADCNGNAIPDECDVVPPFVADSGQLTPIGFESPQTFEITSPPVAQGDVTLSFGAVADLLSEAEFIDVELNGVVLGSVFADGAHDCPARADVQDLILKQELFNEIVGGGDASISMIPSGAVNAASCDGASWISVSVEYSLGGSSEDDNNNGIPDECEVIGDLDADGDVDAADLILLLGAWGACGDCADCPADLDGDCDVDGADLILLLGNWG